MEWWARCGGSLCWLALVHCCNSDGCYVGTTYNAFYLDFNNNDTLSLNSLV